MATGVIDDFKLVEIQVEQYIQKRLLEKEEKDKE
jgi:hypothetical protein